ncbi:winged helix-turn-helix transcriptional regulator [Agrobacterium tumefaciens]|uniref:winged helix-turn-helix domain-containing protein n=1 Tax=Agrobacterium tumefaciens TaxID=358 RepID=UPI0015727709|nr:winged helix-turn-helix transcriptional regulator [Agrobacterium tumefaciens]NTZ60347.1 winged helix-turn-helix transcriptional regulator [Agrobacterium tumefaciens]
MTDQSACACPTCGARLKPDHFSFDAESGLVVSGGRFALLPRREMQIFEFLLERRNRVVTRAALFQEVYRRDDEPEDEAVIETHVSKLRKKLVPLGIGISSERFKGYQLTMEVKHD